MVSQTLTVGGQSSTFFRLERGRAFLQTSNVEDFLCLIEKHQVFWFFRSFLISLLILQTMLIGLLPLAGLGKTQLLDEIMRMFGLLPPEGTRFTWAYILYSTCFWVALLISLMYRYIFCKRRYVNAFWSMVVIYLRPFVDLVLLPYGCSLFGRYVWMETHNETHSGFLSVVQLLNT